MAISTGKTHLAGILPVLLLFLCITDRAFSQEKPYDLLLDKNTPGMENNANHSVEICAITQESGKTFFLFPPGDLYPYYIADPYQIGFALKAQDFITTGIPDTGDRRFYLRAGGNIGVFRYQPAGQVDRGWQLNIRAGIDGQFDNANSQDNIGWNGNYGLVVSMKPAADWAFRFGLLHVSSHLGDEYILRTGATRIGYTREEYAGSVSWAINKHWRTYAEGGWAYHMGNKVLMEPARLQAGLEYENPKSLWKDILGWYAALDVQTWEERDWQVDIAAQTGLLLHSAGRKVRLGIEYYDGRSTLGEFFQYDEKYISLGIWMDI
jgi:hypothetical protein